MRSLQTYQESELRLSSSCSGGAIRLVDLGGLHGQPVTRLLLLLARAPDERLSLAHPQRLLRVRAGFNGDGDQIAAGTQNTEVPMFLQNSGSLTACPRFTKQHFAARSEDEQAS